jgi:ubiquinone/menaquinone biosynthesis C-methylase UbiE
VYGLDVSAEMLALAARYNSDLTNVEWIQGKGSDLSPIQDACVDGCFSHVVFQHIPDPDTTLNYVREMSRVLRPRGWCLFQVSTDPGVHRPHMTLKGRVKHLLTSKRGRRDRHWWGSAIDPADLRAVANETDLEVLKLLDLGTQYTTVLAQRSERRRH